ncbi:anti-sigma factor RsbA family regulatory protein [Nonomuraea sp. NPDC002799]
MTTLTGPRDLVHQALIYDGDAAFLSATLGFCRDGLERDEQVLAVTTEANIALLAGALGDDAARVEFVPAGDWYDAPGRTLAAYSRYVDAHKGPRSRVRIIGEPVWHGRNPLEEAEWTRYESVINAAFAGSPASIVCPYDTRVLPAHIVAGARRTHPALLTGSTAQDSLAYHEPAHFARAADRLPLPPVPAGAAWIPFDDDLAEMRRLVSVQAFVLGLSQRQAARLLLAVNELATNAVQHGAGHGSIRLWADEPAISCEVTDQGRMDLPLAGYLPPAPGAARGHGLWSVRQLCDLVEIRAGRSGTQIRLHLARR